jgi:5'-nucleotidase
VLIACDVDEVVVDMYPAWLRKYNRDYQDTLTPADLTTFHLHEVVKKDCGHDIYGYLEDPDLYDTVEAIHGAVDGVAALRAQGHQVVFVSACTFNMVDQKVRCLQRLGFCAGDGKGALPRDFIAMRDKSRVHADVLIDDAPHNLDAWWRVHRRPTIVFTQPHNRTFNAPWARRAHDWQAILGHISDLTTPASPTTLLHTPPAP